MVYFVMERYRGSSKSPVCLVCGEKPGGSGLNTHALCPACGHLLDWFRGLYADEEGLDLGKLTADTRFLDLMADWLDYVHWVIEAEQQYGVIIPDQDAERLQTVGDYLGYIRFGAGKPFEQWPQRTSGTSDPMWDQQVDA
jgi:acyl carrier protein